MSVLSGFRKFKDYIRDEEGNSKLLSRWTSASTIEYSDGKDGEQKLSELNNAIGSKVDSTKVGVANGVASLDSNGKLPTTQLPEQAIDRLVKVANDAARFALTADDVQIGDSVKVLETEKLYIVVDVTKLSSEDGYEVYTSTLSWNELTDVPNNILYGDSTQTGTVTIPDTTLYKADVVNVLTSTATDAPLSANMGKTLDTKIQGLINDTGATSATTYSSNKIETLLDGVHGTKALTQAQYDALSEEEQKNGTIYQITDAEGTANDAKYINYTNSDSQKKSVESELRAIDSSIATLNNNISKLGTDYKILYTSANPIPNWAFVGLDDSLANYRFIAIYNHSIAVNPIFMPVSLFRAFQSQDSYVTSQNFNGDMQLGAYYVNDTQIYVFAQGRGITILGLK